MRTSPRLERLARLVDGTLARRLAASRRAPRVLREAMRYCVFSGGKRLRPLLCLGSCEAVGAPARRALSIACAIELIHTYSLVHDDLPAMDDAAERRGKPSCHRAFGEGNAILAGDALLTLAFEWLGRHATPDASAVFRTIGRACGAAGLIGGQVLDLAMNGAAGRSTVARLEDVAKRKTAALIEASVVAGALAGGATPAQVSPLARYGRHLGFAFQLVDDLDDQEGLAQAMGADLARAKARRLLARAVESLRPFGPRARVLRELSDRLMAAASGTRRADDEHTPAH